MHIIGLGYKAGCGKDTVARFLLNAHGYVRVAFADRLKRGAMTILGFTEEQVYDEVAKEQEDPFWGFKPRFALQGIGDGLRKHVVGDIWIRAAFRGVESKRVVIPDVRYPNEAEAIKARGGLVIRIDRPRRVLEGDLAKHASETAMDSYEGWDDVLDNSGTVDDLRIKVIGSLLRWEGLIDDNLKRIGN